MTEYIISRTDLSAIQRTKIDLYGGVELVRCKDCMHETDNDCPIKWGKTGEDFCSFAERKENG